MALINNKLEPCPFCGSENLSEEATGALEIYGYEHQTCWIECNSCGTSGPAIDITDDPAVPRATYQAVRDAWNIRK